VGWGWGLTSLTGRGGGVLTSLGGGMPGAGMAVAHLHGVVGVVGRSGFCLCGLFPVPAVFLGRHAPRLFAVPCILFHDSDGGHVGPVVGDGACLDSFCRPQLEVLVNVTVPYGTEATRMEKDCRGTLCIFGVEGEHFGSWEADETGALSRDHGRSAGDSLAKSNPM